VLSLKFSNPTEDFEVRCASFNMAKDGILVAFLEGRLYEVANLMPDGWLVDKNWAHPEQNCNMLKVFVHLFVEVDS